MKGKKICRSVCSLLIFGSVVSYSGLASPSSDIAQKPDDNITFALNADSASSSLFDTIIGLIRDHGADLIKSTLPTVGDYLCVQVFSSLGIDYTDSYTAEISKLYTELTDINNKLDEIINEFNFITLRDFNKSVKAVSKAITPTYKTYDQLRADELNGNYTKEQASIEEKSLYDIVEGLATDKGDFYKAYWDFLELVVTPDSTNANMSLMDLYTACFRSQWGFETEALRNKKEFLTQISVLAYEGFALWTYAYYYNQQSNATTADKNQHKNTYNQMKIDAEQAFQVLQDELNAVIKAEDDGLSGSQTTHYYNSKAKSKVDFRLSTKLYTGKLYYNLNGAHYVDESNYFLYTASIFYPRTNNRSCWLSYLSNFDYGRQIAADYNAYKTRTKQDSSFTLSKYLTYMGFTNADENAKGLYIGQIHRHEGWKLSSEYDYYDVVYIDQNGQEQTVNYCTFSNKALQSPTVDYTEHCYDSFFAIVNPDGYLHGSYEEIELSGGSNSTKIMHRNAFKNSKTYYRDGDKLGKVF